MRRRKALDDEVVMALVDQALAQPAEEREAYVQGACASDPDLRREVWNYVEWEKRMKGFLLEPLCSLRAMEHPSGPGEPLEDSTVTLRSTVRHAHRFEPGELLQQRFRIVREVAQGGMGVVYEAMDEKLKRRIALKCAKVGFGNRLPPEARHASEISHVNVSKIFEIHTAWTRFGEMDFLTMEFLAGETLSQRLARGALPEAEASTIARQLCAGLAEAHRNHVIHGDLKSNNVILTTGPDGTIRAVITDFGLARGAEALLPTAHSGVSGGTPAYMAPELWKGAKASIASDIYALGVIFHELAYGQRPGSSRDAVAHIAKWDRILARCLDADPLRRFRDAEEIAEALAPSHVLRWWLAAAAALALVAGSATIAYERATAPHESLAIALMPFAAGADATALAANVSRDVEAELKHLRGGTRAKLTVIPMAEVVRRHADSAATAGTALGASHVVQGTIVPENNRVMMHAFLTDTHTRANTGDREFQYAPGEVRYAGMAIAGMVTAALGLPAPPVPSVNAAASKDYWAGVWYTRQNSTLDSAIPALQRAIEEDGDSPLTHAALAEAEWFQYYFTRDQSWADRARESVRMAENRDPDTASAHRVEGYLYYKAGLYGRAQTEFERAIQLQPENAMAHIYLGKAYEDNNQLAQALTEFQAATRVESNYFRTYLNLAMFYQSRTNFVEEARNLKNALALAPQEPGLRGPLASACGELGQFSQADRVLRESLNQQETVSAEVSLGQILMYEKNDRDAVHFFRQALHLLDRGAPAGGASRPLILMYLGIAYRRLELRPAADEANRNGLKFAKAETARNYSDGYFAAFPGYFEAALGNRDAAKEDVDRAMSLFQDNSDINWRAVLTYEELYRRFHDPALRDGTFPILRNAKGPELADLNRWPDLADLQRNSRFKDLVNSHPVEDGGNVCAQ